MEFNVEVKLKNGKTETFKNTTEIQFYYRDWFRKTRIAVNSCIDHNRYIYDVEDITAFEAIYKEEEK